MDRLESLRSTFNVQTYRVYCCDCARDSGGNQAIVIHVGFDELDSGVADSKHLPASIRMTCRDAHQESLVQQATSNPSAEKSGATEDRDATAVRHLP